MKDIYFLLIFTVLQSISESARILSVLPTASRSHYLTGRKVTIELARRGHEVVCISPYEEKNAPPNFTWIDLEVKSIYEALPDAKNDNFNEKLSFFESQRRKWDKLNKYSKYISEKPKLKHFIENDGSHFDLVIVEEFFQPAFYAFAYKYKAPLVLLSTFGSGHFINEYMGNTLELSYVSHEFSELYGELTFTDRLLNLVYTTYDLIARKYYSLMYQNQLAKELFKNFKYMPHVEDLERNSSLVLINAHYSLSVVRPTLPNIVEIAGLHIEDVKPLDKNIREILEEAKNGAILFSLGSFMDLSLQPKGFVIELLQTFGKLQQTVMLKWNSEEKLPFEFKNIHAFKWLPQNDILAHPNTVAFITHGGLHSSLEAAHHGVPIICSPFFGDQHLNCKKAVKMGYGIKIANLTDDLHGALTTLLTDKSYRNTAQELSRRFKDRPVSAIDTAMFWIEYVIRHNGADFLKGPRKNLYWFQYMFLDVLAVMAGSYWLLLIIVRKLMSLVFKGVGKKSEKVKKN